MTPHELSLKTTATHLFDEIQTEFSESAQSAASRIVSQIGDGIWPISFDSLRALRIPTADIESICDQLALVAATRWPTWWPCRQIGDRWIPILDDTAGLSISDDNRSIEHVPKDDALRGVEVELSKFLRIRLATGPYLQLAGSVFGMSGNHNLLHITVSSVTVGARVSYAPTFTFSYTALAAPTSPVSGYLPPGRYTFMLNLGNVSKFDTAQFDVPPTLTIPLTA